MSDLKLNLKAITIYPVFGCMTFGCCPDPNFHFDADSKTDSDPDLPFLITYKGGTYLPPTTNVKPLPVLNRISVRI
jgi:hypothetical protein